MMSFDDEPTIPVVIQEVRVVEDGLENYDIRNRPVGVGGYGTVYVGKRRSDDKLVAMKFFGYNKEGSTRPDFDSINRELMLMMALLGVPGAIQLVSIFYDSEQGFLVGKNLKFRQAYPVIVMENISGGELYQRIADIADERIAASEKYLATLFRSVVLALDSIHRRKYIHRDLKADNVLLVGENDAEKNSKVKIIDFGHMVRVDGIGDVYQDNRLHGTPGYYAPESITNYSYSSMSDVWQAGCLLYMMLVLHPPFHPHEDKKSDITQGKYAKSVHFHEVSDSAKDLIDKIFQKDPVNRISLADILKHPWMSGTASDKDLGMEYRVRAKSLLLQQKLQKIFRRGNVSADHPPCLLTGSMCSSTSTSLDSSVDPSENDSSDRMSRYFFDKFDKDKDGHITREELRHAVTKELLREHGGASQTVLDNIDEVFAVMDTNGDQTIEYEEFKVFYNVICEPSSVCVSNSRVTKEVYESDQSGTCVKRALLDERRGENFEGGAVDQCPCHDSSNAEMNPMPTKRFRQVDRWSPLGNNSNRE